MTLDTLRDRILARALEVPPATVVAPCTAVEAYLGAAADIRPLLESDSATAAHVIGVEALVLRWVRGEVTEEDHGAVRSASVDLVAWDGVVRDVAETVAADPTRPAFAYGLTVDAEGLLVLRTFELWTHALDLLGRVPETPPSRLALMSSKLAAALPVAVVARGVTQPGRTARLVLTGVAPGCFDIPLAPGEAPGQPDVTIVADVVQVCRVAARRLPSVAVDAVFEGDESLGRLVLAVADGFAQD